MPGLLKPGRPVACHWCTNLATGTVRATGGTLAATGPLPHCDDHWESAYKIVAAYPERTWQMIEQPPGLLF